LATVNGQVSVGQPPDGKHLGAQKAPGTPETVTFTSPGWQEGVLYGSSYSQVAWGLRRDAPLNCGWKSSFMAGDATATPARRAKMAALFIVVRKRLLVLMNSIWLIGCVGGQIYAVHELDEVGSRVSREHLEARGESPACV